jgi:hypothetical protein
MDPHDEFMDPHRGFPNPHLDRVDRHPDFTGVFGSPSACRRVSE